MIIKDRALSRFGHRRILFVNQSFFCRSCGGADWGTACRLSVVCEREKKAAGILSNEQNTRNKAVLTYSSVTTSFVNWREDDASK